MGTIGYNRIDNLANWKKIQQNSDTRKIITPMRIPNLTTPRIMALAGGKGGVGKTLVSTLIGICLANMKKNTVILDADFSGANLHSCLDTFNPQVSFKDFLEHRNPNVNRLLVKTNFENLHIISGSPGVLGVGNFSYSQKIKIIRNLRKLQADYVVLDLAAGTGYNELDLFLAADDSIIVCNPDPLSIQDAYGFVRSSLLRKLQRTFYRWPDFLAILNKCGNLDQGHGVQSLNDVLDSIPSCDSTWRKLIDSIVNNFRPKLIINMIREDDDMRQIQALRLSIKKILGVTVYVWGKIRFDFGIRTAMRQMRPDLLLRPQSFASEDIVRLVSRNIIAREVLGGELNSNTGRQYSNNEYNSTNLNGRICNYRCVAWNCCKERKGGLPCTKEPETSAILAA